MAPLLVAHVFSGSAQSTFAKLRSDVCALFDVHAALRYPPHLTFVYDVVPKDGGISLTLALARMAAATRPFPVRFTGFGSFDRSTWYADVEQTDDLHLLREEAVLSAMRCYDYKERNAWDGVHFHSTVAQKVSDTARFWTIGSYLHSQPLPVRETTCDSVSLLQYQEQHDYWRVLQTHRFTA